VNDRVEFVSRHLPQLLKNNAPDHDIFFLTETFQNTRWKVAYEHYQQYFKYTMMRFNNALLYSKEYPPTGRC